MNLAPSTEFQSQNAERPEFEPDVLFCRDDQKSIDAALAIKKTIATDGLGDNTQNQTEYGAVVADKGNGVEVGSIVQGQSYNQANPPATNLTPSRNSIGATTAQLVGIIHSHSHSSDPATNLANKRPSPNDWALADQLVAQGASRFRLTLYIIDKWGVLRAYRYVPPSQRTSTYPPADEISTGCE